MIVRIKKRENPYAQIDKRPLFDKRLSFKARGILSYLLAKPDDWKVQVSDLIENSKDGRESVQSGLKELRKCGYAALELVRGKGGKIVGKEWIIYETPTNGFSGYRSPTNGKTVGRENRNTENPSITNNEGTNNDITMASEDAIECEMTFDEFWDKYGFKRGSKKNAVKKWEKLTGADRADIAATLDMYLRDTVTKDTGRKNGFKPLRKHPEFYLSGRIWESYLDQAKEQAEKDSVPTEYDDAYKSYLKWVQDNTPAVLHHTKHLSKQQFIAYKTTYYVKGKSVLGDYLEAKFLMDAHRAMNTNPQELESYPDAFTLHCAKVEQFVKSQPV